MNFRKLTLLVLLGLSVFQLQAQKPKKYKLKVGDQFKVTANIEQEINQTIMGQDIETIQNISTVDLYEVVSVTSEGYRLKTTGLSRTLSMETAQGSTTMDSGLDGDENLAFRVLTNKSYYVEMNRYGKFLKSDGIDAMKEEVKNELNGTALEAQADQLLTAFDGETLSTAFNGQFFIYKERGEPWSRSATTVVGNLPVSANYNFSRADKRTITAEGDMFIVGDIEVMGQAVTADMNGTQSSEYKLDRATGLATSITTVQNMSGSLELEDLSVPMTIRTQVKVTVTK